MAHKLISDDYISEIIDENADATCARIIDGYTVDVSDQLRQALTSDLVVRHWRSKSDDREFLDLPGERSNNYASVEDVLELIDAMLYEGWDAFQEQDFDAGSRVLEIYSERTEDVEQTFSELFHGQLGFESFAEMIDAERSDGESTRDVVFKNVDSLGQFPRIFSVMFICVNGIVVSEAFEAFQRGLRAVSNDFKKIANT